MKVPLFLSRGNNLRDFCILAEMTIAMEKHKIILTRGIQGSGKSTWAKEWVAEKPTERVRWNNDDYRRMLGVYWVPKRETLVNEAKNNFIVDAMTHGYDIVIDNMNLSTREVDSCKNLIKSHNVLLEAVDHGYEYSIEYKDFVDVTLEECIRRDSLRENPIGEKVIRATYKRHKDRIAEILKNENE